MVLTAIATFARGAVVYLEIIRVKVVGCRQIISDGVDKSGEKYLMAACCFPWIARRVEVRQC